MSYAGVNSATVHNIRYVNYNSCENSAYSGQQQLFPSFWTLNLFDSSFVQIAMKLRNIYLLAFKMQC